MEEAPFFPLAPQCGRHLSSFPLPRDSGESVPEGRVRGWSSLQRSSFSSAPPGHLLPVSTGEKGKWFKGPGPCLSFLLEHMGSLYDKSRQDKAVSDPDLQSSASSRCGEFSGIGRSMVMTAPDLSGRFAAAMVPPMASTNPRQIGRPSPVPARTRSPFRTR